MEANLWSDEQKPHQAIVKDKVALQTMNVTESRFKNRQLHMEDYLQMVSGEQKENAEVFDYSKIAE